MPKGVKGFPKGVSGNPKGRPPGGISIDTLYKLVQQSDKEQSIKQKRKVNFIKDYIDRARADETLAKSLFDRLCPVPKQDVNLLGGEGCTINFVFSKPKTNNENANG